VKLRRKISKKSEGRPRHSPLGFRRVGRGDRLNVAGVVVIPLAFSAVAFFVAVRDLLSHRPAGPARRCPFASIPSNPPSLMLDDLGAALTEVFVPAWWMAQSGANCSPIVKFPLISWENTGNFFDFRLDPTD